MKQLQMNILSNINIQKLGKCIKELEDNKYKVTEKNGSLIIDFPEEEELEVIKIIKENL